MGLPVGHGTIDNQTCELIRELRNIRIEKGISQIQLAVDIDTDPQRLGAWERGERDPLFFTVERWARALGYELDLHPIEEHAHVK